MDATANILATHNDVEADSAANKAIREVASTPSPEHVIPAYVVAFLYRHVDLMRREFFAVLCIRSRGGSRGDGTSPAPRRPPRSA